MTTLEKNIIANAGISGALENRITHDYFNGGVKSAYGLSVYQRKIVLKHLFSLTQCNCINCLTKKVG